MLSTKFNPDNISFPQHAIQNAITEAVSQIGGTESVRIAGRIKQEILLRAEVERMVGALSIMLMLAKTIENDSDFLRHLNKVDLGLRDSDSRLIAGEIMKYSRNSPAAKNGFGCFVERRKYTRRIDLISKRFEK